MTIENHLALYRKYRPQSFSDVVGQEQSVTLLEKSIAQNKISHAYLFCGGRGTGKTTVARIFAKDVGCNPEDIIEIDAASNRGIDEIRDLRDSVRTMPFSSPYKVYIIDEAHMLTKDAANAFLKTLEEPPTHVIFILATTDPEKLPSTIVSRCQKVIFKDPSIETLSRRLIYVADKEGKVLDVTSAELIALHGKGSYRDALGILDQVLTTSGKKVEQENVLAFLGITDVQMLYKLLEALGSKDISLLKEVLVSLESSQAIAIRAYDDVVEIMRQGLLTRISKQEADNEASLLAIKYPYTINSKMILNLLERRHLVDIRTSSSWTAFQAIFISLLETE